MNDNPNVYTVRQLKELTDKKEGSGFNWKEATGTIKEIQNLLKTWQEIQKGTSFLQNPDNPQPQQQEKYEKGFQKGVKETQKENKQVKPQEPNYYVDQATATVCESIKSYINEQDDQKTVADIKLEVNNELQPEKIKPFVEQFLKRYAR